MLDKKAFTIAATLSAGIALGSAPLITNHGSSTHATTTTVSGVSVTTSSSTVYASGNITVYANKGSYGMRAVRTILKGTKIAIKGYATVGGTKYNYIGNADGTDEFILTSGLSTSAVARDTQATAVIKIINKNGAALVNSAGVGNSNAQMTYDSQWKIFGTKTIGGQKYYCVGGDQYVLAANTAIVTGTENGSNSPTNQLNGWAGAAPTKTPATSTTTTQPAGPKITAANGQIRINSDAKATVYDQTGKATNKFLSPKSVWKYFGTTTINGVSYYSVGGNQFVRTEAAYVNGTPIPIKGLVTVKTRTFLLAGDGQTPVLNANHTIKAINTGSSWKVFAQLNLGDVTLYDLGGGQYVDAGYVNYTAPDDANNTASAIKMSGTATISYVPGYGVQVWHANGSLIMNANGTAKKLIHGSKWKIYNVLTINGHVYYGLGGDQWIDSSYVTVK